MSKPLASFGVNQIIKTEKNAAQKIDEARKRRVARLKQAQTEAQEEVKKLRAEREEQFVAFKQNANSYGKDAELRVENAAHRAISDMVASAEENRPKVIEEILQLVCDIKPELHQNYFLWKNKNKKLPPPGPGSASPGSRSRYSNNAPPAEQPSKSDDENMDRYTNRSGKSSESSSKSTKPDSLISETRSASPSSKVAMNRNATMCTVCDPNTRTKDGTICNLCDPHRMLLGGTSNTLVPKGRSSTSTGETKSGTSKKGNPIYHTMYKYTSDDVVEWICPGKECGGEEHEEVLPSNANPNVYTVETSYLDTPFQIVMECGTPKLKSIAPKNILFPVEEIKDCNLHGQQTDEIEQFFNDDENAVYTVDPPYLDTPFKIVMPKKLEDCAPKNILLHAGEVEQYIDFNKHNRQNVQINDPSDLNECAVETSCTPCLDTTIKIVMPPKLEECAPKNTSLHTEKIEQYVDLNCHDENNVEVDDYISTTKSTTPAICGDVMDSIIIKTTASIADRMIAFPGGREDQTVTMGKTDKKSKNVRTYEDNMPEGVIISSTDTNVIIKISSKPNNQYTLALNPPSLKCGDRHASSEQPIVILEESQDITNSQQQSKNTARTTKTTSKISPTLNNQNAKEQDNTPEF